MVRFASPRFGRERRPGAEFIPRHRHGGGYLAVVLDGAYEEAGEHGRHRVRAGDVILHGRFEAHLNRMSAAGAAILNLPLPDWAEPALPLCRAADPDLIARTVERDLAEAVMLLWGMLTPVAPAEPDWPDALALSLAEAPTIRLSDWAAAQHLAPATLSRGFRQVYGVTPALFRAEARARLAWQAIVHRPDPLSQIAAELGFADQAHMTRLVRSVTGVTPGAWRRSLTTSNRFKTEGFARN